MILSPIAAMALQATSQSVVPLGTHRIDPVLAPYIRRYVDCIEGRISEEAGHLASTEILRRAYEDGVAACAEVRRTEYARAERALARSRRAPDAEARRRLVANSFRRADQVRNRYGDVLRRELAARPTPRPVAEPAEVRQPATAVGRSGSIAIPPAIAGAVRPYMQCKMERTNADPRLPTGDPAVLRAIGADSAAACADIRRQGFERADAILRRDQRHRGRAARDALINGVFAQIDGAFESLIPVIPKLPDANAQRAPEN